MCISDSRNPHGFFAFPSSPAAVAVAVASSALSCPIASEIASIRVVVVVVVLARGRRRIVADVTATSCRARARLRVVSARASHVATAGMLSASRRASRRPSLGRARACAARARAPYPPTREDKTSIRMRLNIIKCERSRRRRLNSQTINTRFQTLDETRNRHTTRRRDGATAQCAPRRGERRARAAERASRRDRRRRDRRR